MKNEGLERDNISFVADSLISLIISDLEYLHKLVVTGLVEPRKGVFSAGKSVSYRAPSDDDPGCRRESAKHECIQSDVGPVYSGFCRSGEEHHGISCAHEDEQQSDSFPIVGNGIILRT